MRSLLAPLVASLVLISCGQSSGGGHLASGGGSTSSGGQPNGGGPSSGGAPAAGGDAPDGSTGGSAPGGSSSGGTPGSGGDDTSGGGGSGGEPPICPGVPVSCEPGASGCSDRGEAYVCSACGQPLYDGTECARLLTADKEGGLVCVVRGERHLVCAGGPVEWSPELEFPVELPVFVTRLSLPDDSTQPVAEIAYCAVTEEGGLSCTAGFTPPGGVRCTDVAVSDSSAACSICDGTLECPGLSVPSVEQVALVDTAPFWLNSAGEIHSSWSDGPLLPGKYVLLFLDDFQMPCGIEEDRDLACSLDGGNTGNVIEIPGPFLDGAARADGMRCAVGEDGRISCFVVDESGVLPVFAPPGTDFSHVVATRSTFCGLTRAGLVHCWDTEGLLPELSDALN